MLKMRRNLITASIVGFIAIWLPAAWGAETTPPEAKKINTSDSTVTKESTAVVKKISDMLTSMGYKVTRTTDDFVDFEVKNWGFYGTSASNGSRVYLQTYWNIAAENLGKIPRNKLFEWNNTHATYFSIAKNDDGTNNIVLHQNFDIQNLNPLTLRETIDMLDLDSDEADKFVRG